MCLITERTCLENKSFSFWNDLKHKASFFFCVSRLKHSFWKTKCAGMNTSKPGNLEVFDEEVCEGRPGESITDCNEPQKITSNSWWISSSNCFALLTVSKGELWWLRHISLSGESAINHPSLHEFPKRQDLDVSLHLKCLHQSCPLS